VKTFILVAGVDYDFKGVDFRIFCRNRMKRVVAANTAKADLRFKIMDFRRGEVVTHEITYPGGKKTETATPLSPSPFGAIGTANYNRVVSGSETHYEFKDGQSGTMSVLDVYRAIRDVGASDPGTLAELSFFSHGWLGGPLLVNSYDDGRMMLPVPGGAPMAFIVPSGARDPDDMDPRGAKDFVPPTTDAAALADMKAAFAPGAFIWSWGCAFPRLVHELLHKIERHPTYRDSGLSDGRLFIITNLNDRQATLLENWIKHELGGPFPDKRRIELEWKWIKFFFCKVTAASYSHQIAKALNVKTFAGVMGTYSEYDSGSLPLMSIHKGFARHFTFYKNYLGFAFDPEGRKYGEFSPSFTCTVPPP
jgi:hypothetical protein